jgi:dynein light chain Tctex-type 1
MFNVLESKRFSSNSTAEWTDVIANKILERLRAISQNFKYIVNIGFVQKVGAGLHFETLAHWDMKADGVVQVKYENDSLICICTVIGVGL